MVNNMAEPMANKARHIIMSNTLVQLHNRPPRQFQQPWLHQRPLQLVVLIQQLYTKDVPQRLVLMVTMVKCLHLRLSMEAHQSSLINAVVMIIRQPSVLRMNKLHLMLAMGKADRYVVVFHQDKVPQHHRDKTLHPRLLRPHKSVSLVRPQPPKQVSQVLVLVNLSL